MLIFPTVLILALVQSSIVGYYQVFFMESSLLSVMSLVSGLFPPICTHDGLNFDSAWRSEMKVAQSHPTLCDSMGYTVHGILQARILERVAFPFSRGIFPTQGSNAGLPHCRQIFLPAEPQGKPKNTGVGCLSLLQGVFLTQESNQGLLHCRQILYQLSYQEAH